MLGKRYKSLVQDDFDLCETCFGKLGPEAQHSQQWARVQSSIFGSVIATTYAPPQSCADGPIHHYITCDKCNMSPIIGKRFKCNDLPDYDLCGECYTASKADPEWASRSFDEICVVEATGNTVATDTMVRQSAASLPSLDAEELRSTLESLLRHPKEEVRTSVAAAVLERPCKVRRIEQEHEPVEEKDIKEVPQSEKPSEETQEEQEQKMDEDEKPEPEKPVREDTEEEWLMTESTVAPVETATPAETTAAQDPPPAASAAVVSASLLLGIEAQEDPTARGDITQNLAEQLAQVGAHQAFMLGNVVMPCSEGPKVPVCAKYIVMNNGQVPWPETTALHHISGQNFDFDILPLGAISPKQGAEVVMDLHVPARSTPGEETSAWMFVDVATGKPLGPLVLLKVNWVAQ
jgi:hypothetical protein